MSENHFPGYVEWKLCLGLCFMHFCGKQSKKLFGKAFLCQVELFFCIMNRSHAHCNTVIDTEWCAVKDGSSFSNCLFAKRQIMKCPRLRSPFPSPSSLTFFFLIQSRCAQGYTGNPLLGQKCFSGNNDVNGTCYALIRIIPPNYGLDCCGKKNTWHSLPLCALMCADR